MANTPYPPLPQEMRDLLIRLDTKVDIGFLQIGKKLDQIELRQSSHEADINMLKGDVTAIKTATAARLDEYKEALRTIDANTRRLDKAEGAMKFGQWILALLVPMLIAIGVQVWMDHRAQGALEQQIGRNA
jgi:hypothetical protein